MSQTRIHRLPAVLIDRIAAGEVVDGPYSVIKELVENSLDAGASKIRVSTEGGGLSSITIEDDGDGILFEDLPFSVERHATSKINELHDIEKIYTFGFRGEALASIAAISLLEIRSRHKSESIGGFLESRGGEIVNLVPQAVNQGTTITVRDLFYSVPARRKFLKSERTENARIQLQLIRIAFAHPSVQFTYVRDGKILLDLPSRESLPVRAGRVFRSKNLDSKLNYVEEEAGGIRISGYFSNPGFHKSNREGQFVYVNNRHVEFKNLPFMIKRAYAETLPPGAHPYYFIFLECEPSRVDVNVHPAKKEVRFLDEQLFQALIYKTINKVLSRDEPLAFIPDIHANPKNYNYESTDQNTYEYKQENISKDNNLFSNPDSDGSSIVREKNSYDVRQNQADEKNSKFLPRKHFGVIFGTYILAEADDGLYIIDQHTAHERIHYERIRKLIEKRSGERQGLLHPVAIKVTPDELEGILENRDFIEENGFAIEALSEDSYVVREVPFYVESGEEEEVISHLITRILDGDTAYRLYDEYAALKACKASIKRNDFVAGEVISDILYELSQTEDPSRCPHGRPTMIKITRQDLDRMFLR